MPWNEKGDEPVQAVVTLDSFVTQGRRSDEPGNAMSPDERRLSDEAVRWRVRLQAEDLTDEERRSFEEWTRRSDRHRTAYARIDSLWRDLDAPSRHVWEEVRRGVEPADAAVPPVSLRWKRPALIAASVLLAVLAGLWVMDFGEPWTPGLVRTARGEHASRILPDGSTVHLNTDSVVSVEFTDQKRRLVLKRGEAWFSVASEPARPFAVEAGGGTVRAIGTEFNVRQDHDGTTVTVIEGTVEVSPSTPPASLPPSVRASVGAGEQVRYSRSGGMDKVVPADLVQVTGWRRGQLVFDLKPLGDVVEEVDRYWPGRILVLSPDLRRHRVSGVFKTGDPDAVVHALETTFQMKSLKVAGLLIILYQ